MPITRRSLLNALAGMGGAGAVHQALAAWDFFKPSPAMAASLALPRESGRGKTVAILGAGVSGLCAAYELDRAGYDCIVLEASRRAGGRSLTLRRGDTLRELGHAPQVCEFDEGQWFNAGPGRIPHHHVHVIDYCRRFNVALQPYIFTSRANLVHSSKIGNGKTIQVRRAYYDLKGHVAELLSKCAATPGVDLPVTGTDLEKLQDMLATFGDLTKVEGGGRNAPNLVYRNKSGRAGFEIPPGLAGQPIKPLTPLALDEILRSHAWDSYIFHDAAFDWQTSLLEPVGGMDNFFKGFLRQPLARQSATIESLVRTGAKVTGIEVRADRVAVQYADGAEVRVVEADYCISTIPLPIFRELKTNLPEPYMQAARKIRPDAAGKVGWQSERFWETKDNIYGGISWTTDVITQVWYPSSGFLGAKGVLTGAYMYGDAARKFNARPVAERLQIAREQGDKLHDGFGKHVGQGLAIGWNNMEFERMGWVDEGDPEYEANAVTLLKPQGRFLMAGDQLSFLSGWQEGAILAAWNAVTEIDKQVSLAK